jgi:hypothetical protein
MARVFAVRSCYVLANKTNKWGTGMGMQRSNDAWHRRQAVAIASTLPEDISDARTILRLTMELLDGFLSGGGSVKTGECALASQPQPEDA